jgi:hypothetical protein
MLELLVLWVLLAPLVQSAHKDHRATVAHWVTSVLLASVNVENAASKVIVG